MCGELCLCARQVQQNGNNRKTHQKLHLWLCLLKETQAMKQNKTKQNKTKQSFSFCTYTFMYLRIAYRSLAFYLGLHNEKFDKMPSLHVFVPTSCVV